MGTALIYVVLVVLLAIGCWGVYRALTRRWPSDFARVVFAVVAFVSIVRPFSGAALLLAATIVVMVYLRRRDHRARGGSTFLRNLVHRLEKNSEPEPKPEPTQNKGTAKLFKYHERVVASDHDVAELMMLLLGVSKGILKVGPLAVRDISDLLSHSHKPEFAFGDSTPLSTGVNNISTRRNVPSIVNRVFSTLQLTDGRAESLETQVLHPILTRGELGREESATQLDDLQTLINRLNQASSGYPARFQTAFGGPPTLARVSRALAHYVRSIIAQPSTFDTGTLTAQQAFGWRIFSGKGLCTSCHSGPNFTDERFHDIGVFQVHTAPDDGRYVATGSLDDLFEFRTPSLRNVTKTAPYFHDGSRPTLASVVDFYNDGGAELKRRGKSVHIRPLRLTSTEKAALVAFLQTLESLPTASAPSGIASATPVP